MSANRSELAGRLLAIREHCGDERCPTCITVKEAAGALDATVEEGGWMPIESAPEGIKIVVSYPNAIGNFRTVMAERVGKFQRESTEGDCEFDEYDESTDNYYWVPGWYEINEAKGESWFMGDLPTHWRSLPPPPRTDR